MSEHKKSSTSGRPIFFAVVFISLVAFAGLIWYLMERNPEISIPPPPPKPTPNAYDSYLAAMEELDRDVPAGGQLKQVWNTTKQAEEYTPAERKAVFTATQPALAKIREGLHYRYQGQTCRSFATVFPEFSKFRGLARYLNFAGEMKAEQGDWGGAMQCHLDAMHIGNDVPHGSVMIGMLVGIACQAIGRGNCWETIDHLNAAQARAAAKRLEAIMDDQVSLAQVLQEESWSGQAALMEYFQQKNWRRQFQTLINPGGTNNADALPLLLMSKRQIMNRYREGMDVVIASASAPYAETGKYRIPENAVTRVLLPVHTKVRQKYISNEVQNDLLLVTLALRAYKVEHGKYPASLKELTPTYITKIPQDPFVTGKPLQYKVTGGTYLLYSIGPDGKDDGGKVIEQSNPMGNSEDARYFIFGRDGVSNGDVVAGVNRW